MADKTIEAYAASLPDWGAGVVTAAVETIRAAAPGAVGSIKWAQPVFESDGPFAYIKAFPRSVSIGFWRGAELADPQEALDGNGDRMKHVTLRQPDDLDREQLAVWVREAVQLNAEKGNPTKR